METKQTYQYDVIGSKTYRLVMDRPLSAEEESEIKEFFEFPEKAAWQLTDMNTHINIKEVS